MAIWETLGINETKNKDEIQAAYRSKLSITNPEDHPEEFMKLREAFEAAIKKADSVEREITSQAAEGQNALTQWMERVDELYNNFAKRINPENWKALLEDDVCQNLDTKISARGALLDYMLEHFFIPQSVMKLFDQHFGLLENMDELREIYEEDFLQIVVKEAIEEREYPPYEYFNVSDPSLPFDDYLLLSARLHKSMEKGSKEECKKILAQMEETGVKTPYFQLEQARFCCQEENFEKARLIIDKLLPSYQDLEDVILLQGDIAFALEFKELARVCYKKALDKNPQSAWARYGIGKCLIAEGDYKEAGGIFELLLQENPYDAAAEAGLIECNQHYREYLENLLEQGNAEQNMVVDLAWCYYQADQYEKAWKLLEKIEPEEAIKSDYYSVLSRSCVYDSQWEKSLEHLKSWEALLKDAQGVSLDEKSDQLSYNLMLQGLVFQNKKEWDDAARLLDQAIDLAPDSGECFQQKAKLLFNMGDYEGAIELCTKAIELGSDFHTVYLLRAQAYYEIGILSDAYQDCDKAIEIYPYELRAYIYKIKALIESEEFEAAEEILEDLKDEGISGSELEFLRGYMQEEEGHHRMADKIFRGIISRHKTWEPAEDGVFNMDNLAEVYHHLANMNYDEDAEDYAPIVDLIDMGLELDSEYVPLLELKANIFHSCEMEEDAVALFKQIWRLQPAKDEICLDIEDAYRGLEQWDHALEWVQRQIDTKPSPDAYLRKGQILVRLRRLEEALEELNRALDMKPDLYEVYNTMGLIMDVREKEDEAAFYYDKAIQLGERDELPCEDAYKNRANLYCRAREFGKSIELLERAYGKTGSSDFLYEQIGVYKVAGMFDQALTALKRFAAAENLKKMDFFYNWEKANIERDRGKLDRASDLYEPEALIEPAARKEVGKILYYRGKYKKALKLFRKAIEQLDREHEYPEAPYDEADYYLWTARTCLNLKDEKTAAAFALEGMKRIPEDFENKLQYCLPRLYCLKGALCSAAGNYEEAERLLNLALKERKCDLCNYAQCAAAFYELGCLYEQRGQAEQAMAYYKEGRQIAPYDSDLALAMDRFNK